MNLHCLAKTTAYLTLFISQASLAQTKFQAETISTESILLTQVPEEKAILRTVKNRFGGQFTTGAGVGYESSFGSISGFIPLLQMPGQELFYFDGRLNFDTEDANPSGSALVGYRQYSPELNVVFGGYIGTDLRETDRKNTFSQIGVGFEALGDPWEIRANAYIPVGDRREVIGESVILDAASLNFQNHFLLYDATQSKVYEESLMGLEMEGGIRLLDWAGGDLRGYLGTYLYDTPNGSGFIGFNSRLLARISDNFSTGLSLSADGQFGTNLVFTVGASFGGNAPATRDQTLDESILARLGDNLSRRSNVAVRQVTEAIALNDLKVTNPVTGDP
ncbi:MAG: hypothetical protein HC799_00025 [Limnothrix sp. RL_2_0]|nr:hypothetical protein [Limnothrix sp. RL_2_0]